MVVQCPVGVSVSGIVIEVCVCGSDSVGIIKAVLWQVQCNRVRSRSNGEDTMVVRHPVKRLGIVRRDRPCMLEQWATIQRSYALACSAVCLPLLVSFESIVTDLLKVRLDGTEVSRALRYADSDEG
jgi:hypothetical protein